MNKIYSGIPVPCKIFRKRKDEGADQLEVGQCMFFQAEKDETDAEKSVASTQVTVKRITNLVNRLKNADEASKSKKFVIRVCLHPETNEKAVGLWRIA